MRRSTFAAGLLAGSVVAWRPSLPPLQQPAAGASRDTIVLDVSVTDRTGLPVQGLRAGDFVVKVDGQPRRIVSVQMAGPAAGPAAEPADAARAVGQAPAGARRPRYSSNEAGVVGRLILVVVDDTGIPVGGVRGAEAAVETLLAEVGPSDRVGLATLPGPRTLVPFTADRQRIVEGIRNLSGGGALGGAASGYRLSVLEAFAVDRGDTRVYDGVVRRECAMFTSDVDQARCPDAVRSEARRVVVEAGSRVRQFANGLGSLIEAIGRIDAPKTVILFSQGVASPEAASTLQALAPAVAAARAAIYVVRLERTATEPERGLSFAADDRIAASASLDALAGIGRGTVVEVGAAGEAPFRRLAAEMSSLCLVGVESEAGDRDGRPHRIEVSVGKPDVTVRARPTFVARSESGDESSRVVRALQSPVLATELAVRLTAFNLADESPGLVRVLVSGEIDQQQEAGGAVLVAFALFGSDGKAAATASRQMDLPVNSSGRLAFVGGASVLPGHYRLKLAAVRGGRTGSAEHPFEARLTPAAALQVGDLVLAEPPPPGRTIAPAVDGRLRGNRIVAYLQLGHESGATKELAVDIVKKQDGATLLSVPFTLKPSGARATAIQASIDVSLLPPGDYGARLIFPAGDAPGASAYATFSLERLPRVRGPKADRDATAPPPLKTLRFDVKEVLDGTVLGPFLDELARRAPSLPAGAIEKARAGRFDAALEDLKAGSGPDPGEPFIRGLALLSKGQLQPASDAFRESVRASPDFLLGAFYLGACYGAGGRTEQAVNAWQTSLVGLGRFPVVYRVLGEALIQAGDAERALEVLARGTARWPDDQALGARALRAALDAGRFDQAMVQADRVLSREPVDADLLFVAMQAMFEAVLEDSGQASDVLLGRIRRFQDRYAAAGGPRQALVGEWVAFVEARWREPHAPGTVSPAVDSC